MFQNHLGEILSVAVAFFWTGSALAFEYAGHRVGSLMVNIFRLLIGFVMLSGLLWIISGSPLPQGANTSTWLWMLLSGAVGFVFGDMCLFYSYLLITSRFSQLIMTLAPPIAALFGFVLLGEHIRPMGLLAMGITLFGIALAIFGRKKGGENKPSSLLKLNLPLRGVLLALGGAIGQGLGIVLSKKGMDVYNHSVIAESLNSDFLYQLTSELTIKPTIYIPLAATQIRIIAGIVGFIAIILFMRQAHRLRSTFNDRRAMGVIAIGSFCGPFAGVSLSLMAVQYTETGIASTVMAIVPIIIIIPSVLLFKQKITVREVVGAFISVIGVALFFIK